MKNLILFYISFVSHSTLSAQWTDNGSSLTTTDKVGIGITNSNSSLEIKSSSYNSPIMNIISLPPSGNSADNIFQIKQNNDGDGWIQIGNRYTNSGEPNKIRLHSNGTSWFDGGNVGIGTTTPQHTLDIDGNFSRGTGIKHIMHLTHNEATDTGDGTSLLFTNRGHSSNDYGGYIALVSTGASPGWLNPRLDFAVQNPNTHQISDISSKMSILGNGNVGIGTNNPDAKLAVNGHIHTKEVKVDLVGWPDYVFEKDYALPTLDEVENYIKEEGRLKDIPSAKEVEENGVFLGEMEAKLLQKIEELTLYTIQQQKEIEILQQENEELKLVSGRIDKLEKLMLSSQK